MPHHTRAMSKHAGHARMRGGATETCECLEVARKALGNDLPIGESN